MRCRKGTRRAKIENNIQWGHCNISHVAAMNADHNYHRRISVLWTNFRINLLAICVLLTAAESIGKYVKARFNFIIGVFFDSTTVLFVCRLAISFLETSYRGRNSHISCQSRESQDSLIPHCREYLVIQCNRRGDCLVVKLQIMGKDIGHENQQLLNRQ